MVTDEKLAARHRVEQDFHDRAALAEPDEFWTFGALDIPDRYLRATLGDLSGKAVLEIGCGDGATTIDFARAGASVTAIDISPEMVATTRTRAGHAGWSGSVRAIAASGEDLDFDPESFDVIYGHSVLHHLDLSIAGPRIARALRKGGLASFLDPLDHNPVLNLLRAVTPGMRTPTEKPLSLADIRALSANFASLERREFHLVSLAAYFWYYVIKNRRLFALTMSALSRVDAALFTTLPFLRRYAWVTVLTFRK